MRAAALQETGLLSWGPPPLFALVELELVGWPKRAGAARLPS